MTPTPLMQRLDADFAEMFGHGRDATPLFGTDVIPSNRDIEQTLNGRVEIPHGQ